MTDTVFGALLFGVCLLLIGLRMPVGVAMFVVGGFGFASLAGWSAFLNSFPMDGASWRRATQSGP